jgi:hypothetical protein
MDCFNSFQRRLILFWNRRKFLFKQGIQSGIGFKLDHTRTTCHWWKNLGGNSSAKLLLVLDDFKTSIFQTIVQKERINNMFAVINNQNNNNEVSPWKNSKAKELLSEDIIAGIVDEGMEYRSVYLMREDYHKYNIKNFQVNLRNLIKAIRGKQEAAKSDQAALTRDNEIKNARTQQLQHVPKRWNGSRAEELLGIDIKNGAHRTMTPRQLWHQREEYKEFDATIFRKHVHQESRRRIANSYWLDKQKQSKKKK